MILRSAIFESILTLSALLMLGCGGDAGEQGIQGGVVPDHIKALDAKKTATAAKKAVPVQTTVNPAWNSIRPHFLGASEKAKGDREPATDDKPLPFIKLRADKLRDPFSPMLVEHAPKMQIKTSLDDEVVGDDDAAVATEAVSKPEAAEVGATERSPLMSYKPSIILWGVTVSKALVVDGAGIYHTVKQDMRLGNQNGRIISITNSKIWVQEDNSVTPVALSIEPESYEQLQQEEQ